MENRTGRFIAQRRKELKMTQKELAEKLGVTNKAVSKWETGQGLPDVSVLAALSKALNISVDELLAGEKQAEKKLLSEEMGDREEESSLLDIVAERLEKKIKATNIDWKDVLGVLFFVAAVMLIMIQIWYFMQGKKLGLEYISKWVPYFLNGMVIFFLWFGGLLVKKLRPVWKSKTYRWIFSLLLFSGIAVCRFLAPVQKEIIRISPDFSEVLCLKIDESGRAVFYRQRSGIFASQADVFPFTVKENVKVQWLEDDVCTLTYESTEDDDVHQYVATYGARDGNESYYYVINEVYGTWLSEGQYGGYKLTVGTGPDGGIDIQTPDGKEHYEIEECIQYGTLAVVFPANAPKWTLVLNKDYTFSTDEDVEKAGGTLSLCRINMKKTAPLILHGM